MNESSNGRIVICALREIRLSESFSSSLNAMNLECTLWLYSSLPPLKTRARRCFILYVTITHGQQNHIPRERAVLLNYKNENA